MITCLEDMRVRDIIDIEHRCWNSSLMNVLFNIEDSKVIHTIPLSNRESDDQNFWKWSKDDTYTVCFAYHGYITTCNSNGSVEGRW
uniref:Uncharacterized protein n=1 Tax=Cajanus cajan TaxID=3821 RepID=A0A151R4H3_CAJCA|nr:hypothetical protein KK1_041383 [Cajanus cajan]